LSLTPGAKNHAEAGGGLWTAALVAVWASLVTGLVEGAGLMLFQRLNWASWGPMLHVSAPILWVSPLFDLAFFLALAGLVMLAARILPRLLALPVLVFLLSGLAVYDWLTLTARLHHWSCLLLAIGVGAAFTRWFSRNQLSVLRFWRRTVPWVVAIAILTFVAVEGGHRLVESRALAKLPAASPGSPNVLVIVVDTLRADHLSSYGYSRATSPNIDRLAREGTLFENAMSSCSWSLPSHVSMLTGLYQYQHGVTNVQPMPVFGSYAPSFGGHLMLGEALERRGYRTAAFSANRTWFSHDLGFGRGFLHFEDYFHSVPDAFIRTLFGREFSRIYLARSDRSLPRRFLRWAGFDSLLDSDDEGLGAQGGAPGIRKRAPVVNRELLHWIDNGSHGRPFFAFINYFGVHSPYGGPQSYPDPWPSDDAFDQYDDGVRYVDLYIGRLMAELERRGLSQSTLVIVTGDHGESLGQHGLESHGQTLYLEQIHVPLIFWYPGHVPAGERISANVSNVAIPATVMSVIDSKAGSEFPGPALTSLWSAQGSGSGWPAPLSELAKNKYVTRAHSKRGYVPTAKGGSMKSVVDGPWQLIIHDVYGPQLFDWKNDPGESRNLIHTADGEQAARVLEQKMIKDENR
jgi:arylsulfatase A-like enzyme